jgi:hypothetical protein
VSVNGILVEDKMCIFTLESTHFMFDKCPIYTHDGASAKFSTNSHETDYSVGDSLIQYLSHTNYLVKQSNLNTDQQLRGFFKLFIFKHKEHKELIYFFTC